MISAPKRKRSKFRAALRRLSIEALEGRAMLAGNVAVSVSSGNLFIRGDNVGNGVYVEQVSSGSYSVTGFNWDGSATKINGSSNATAVFSGVVNINIDLKKGNDALGIGNDAGALLALAEECGIPIENATINVPASLNGATLEIPGSLIVSTGDGSDAMAVIANIHGSAVVNAGSQDDYVAVGSSAVDHDLVIVTENGKDHVCVEDSEIQGHLNILTGNDDDDVFVGSGPVAAAPGAPVASSEQVAMGGTFAAHMLINTGNGNDRFALIEGCAKYEVVAITGNGDDAVFLENYCMENLTVDTGEGSDNVSLDGYANDGWVETEQASMSIFASIVKGQMTIVTGGGNDQVDLQNFKAGGVLIDTGAGNDGTALMPVCVGNASIANLLKIVGGSGDDRLRADHFEATNVVIDSGANNDIVEVYNPTIANNLSVFTGAGNDIADIEGGAGATASVGRDLLLDMGAGNDIASLIDLIVHHDLNAYLGAGNDSLNADNVRVDDVALLDAGAGNDGATISNSNSSVGVQLKVFMGAGNDTLTITGSGSSTPKAFLRGGAGTDTLNLGVDNTIGTLDQKEFETVNTIV